MVTVKEVIVVEGRYDKNTLLQVVDADVFTTEGFGIFRDPARQELLRRLAARRGILIFTDPDGAGRVIRGFLNGIVDPRCVKNAYIPDIPGKERRKSSPSKEGKLGVEGMTPEIILHALRAAGATLDAADARKGGGLTKADLYALGLSGGAHSAALRTKLQRALALPTQMSANALLQVLNVLTTREELAALLRTIEQEDEREQPEQQDAGRVLQQDDG
jgi:ribonuclease M5